MNRGSHRKEKEPHQRSHKFAFYVVFKGRQPGIYSTWDDCDYQVCGFPGYRFKGFMTWAEAWSTWTSHVEKKTSPGIRADELALWKKRKEQGCSSNPQNLATQLGELNISCTRSIENPALVDLNEGKLDLLLISFYSCKI